MFKRPILQNAKLGILGLTTVLILGAVLLPIARAQKQSVDNASDLDKDGLENRLEAELGTNPESFDTDGDGLSDYDEYCKYRTDPVKKDSDGDGKPDGDWQERREYAYSIKAICEIRLPSSLDSINDLYQDARPVEKKATLDDAKVVEVLIFPFATAHVYPQPYPQKKLDKKLRQYIQPTASMNFSSEMKEEITKIVQGAATDVETIEKILQWMSSETSLERKLTPAARPLFSGSRGPAGSLRIMSMSFSGSHLVLIAHITSSRLVISTSSSTTTTYLPVVASILPERAAKATCFECPA